jgi:hypothetical protein
MYGQGSSTRNEGNRIASIKARIWKEKINKKKKRERRCPVRSDELSGDKKKWRMELLCRHMLDRLWAA